uniref:O-antigen ligase domain-containing protein n=1 Tax=candidate division CPR3 bacterium TaxID=2268181 RepID=A0A7V3N4U1_UNCC3
MNQVTVIFLILASFILLVAPRKWAALPFLMAACYITVGQVIKIGPFHFTAIRILVAVGMLRLLLRSERPSGGLNGLDWLVILWGIIAISVTPFHKDPEATLINHLGRAYDTLGIYFLMRSFFRTSEEAKDLIKIIAILLVPVALEMLYEQMVNRNLFSFFGGVGEVPAFREGHFRSQGPFRHSILAGTVGAVCFPLMIGIWRNKALIPKLGIGACLLMVVTSFSSGPWMSLIWGLIGLLVWRWRHRTREMLIVGIISYVLLDLVMKAPAYYLIARIDFTGGSTGWHRAYLIESSIKHINEWWLFGTDYTRHWMPTGVSWSPDHSDITNHYLMMGVIGGLSLMFFFITILWMGFRYVIKIIQSDSEKSYDEKFFVWCMGSSLFAHTVTMIGVSYFDQSFLFLYLVLAIIASSVKNDKLVFSQSK